MFNFKKFGIVYLLIALIVVMFILRRIFPNVTVYSLMGLQTVPIEQPVAVETRVIINYGDTQESYDNINGRTPYDALLAVAKEARFEVKTAQRPSGLVVEQIGTVANTATAAWIYYVNGVVSDQAADKKPVQTGDVIEWKYTKSL